MNVREKAVLGREKSKCKGPEAGTGLECLRNRQKPGSSGSKRQAMPTIQIT